MAYTLIMKIDASLVGCDDEKDLEIHFDTMEAAQEYIDIHPELTKEAYQWAMDTFEPSGWIEIEEIIDDDDDDDIDSDFEDIYPDPALG